MAGRPWGRATKHPQLAAALLFGLLVFGYLWPVLVGGKILSPIAVLYSYPPWQAAAPKDLHSYYNLLLLDLPTENYPWRFLIRKLLHAGTFPAWDPYVLTGIPLFQSPQNGLFSIFNLPLWVLPITYALGLSAAIKLVVGAFGTYLLARRLRLGFLPGLLAGVVFAFSAINVTWLVHDTIPGVVVMVPWALWLVERLFERRRPRDALVLALVIAIGIGGGHPGMQVHLLFVTAAYALLRALCAPAPPLRPAQRLRALLLIGGGLAVGAALMAFILIPEVRSSRGTVGVLARTTNGLPGQHLPFSVLKTIVFPDWWGRPSAIEPPRDPSNILPLFVDYSERTFYAGTVALLLACVGLLARGEWRRKAPFVVLGVLGLALAVRAPGLYWLYTHLPVLKDVEAQRLHFAFELGVAVLAAFGLQALLDATLPSRAWLVVPLLAVAGGAFALATAHPLPGDVAHTVTHFLQGTGYRSKAVLAMTSVVWFLLFVLVTGALLALARWRPRWRTGIAVAIVALAVADAYHFVGNFQPMAPRSKVFPPVTRAVAYLERHRDDGRTVGLNGAFQNDWPLVYGIRDVRGYDSPQPTQRMFELWLIANPIQVYWTPLSLEDLGGAQTHVLGVLGGRYIVAEAGYRIPPGAPRTLTVAYRGRDATIVENPAAVPRVLVPAALRVTAGERATREAIAEARFDPRRTVAVEGDQPGVAELAEAPLARGTAAVVRERNASVTLRTHLDRRGLVMLDDDFTDGWRVRVDGRPARALHVDDVVRGVIVPAGSHEVTWSYTVPGLALGVAITLLTLLGLAGAATALRLSSRRAVSGNIAGWGSRAGRR